MCKFDFSYMRICYQIVYRARVICIHLLQYYYYYTPTTVSVQSTENKSPVGCNILLSVIILQPAAGSVIYGQIFYNIVTHFVGVGHIADVELRFKRRSIVAMWPIRSDLLLLLKKAFKNRTDYK